MSAPKPELTVLDALVSPDARRITIADHERWQQTGEPPHKDDADLDELVAEIRSADREAARQ